MRTRHRGFWRALNPCDLEKKGVQPGEAHWGIRTFGGGQDLRQRVRRRYEIQPSSASSLVAAAGCRL